MIELSVLIPTYNRAGSLERCLRSVLSSKLSSMEVVVSDNASPDFTQDIIASFRDPRLRAWRNDTNIGVEKNIQLVLEASRGKWVFYLTDDDCLLPKALEKLIAVLRANDDVGVLLSPLRQTKEDGTPVSDYRFLERNGRLDPGLDALTHLIPGTHIISRMTMRREWLDLQAVKRQTGSLYPQTYMAGIILKEHPGYYLDEFLVCHTVGNKTFWDYPDDFMVSSRLQVIENMLPDVRWRRERTALTNQVITEIFQHHFPISWAQRRWRAHHRILRQTPQLRFSPRYWFGVGRFLFAKVLGGVKSWNRSKFKRPGSTRNPA
jgi:glycosyltransferase involved in cell wall biosynthesis